MSKGQWFLAHSKSDEPEDIDVWCQELAEALSQDGWEAVVVSGRDDFSTRSAALGGWKAWCNDVPSGVHYTGAPLYHGVIVPIDSLIEEPTVGKATAQILKGFVDNGKHVYAWCPDSKEFRNVQDVVETEDDNWTAWAKLEFVD